ncbi:hypothetical protein KA057_01935 [Candidatus Gracilibacteria bacterium]|nr:hypothetical protein [Candidatus Gracilibacteria bacterium]
MKRTEEALLEKVSKEATSSILSDYGGIAPFDVDALIIRPGFEYNRFADEPLRIIGSAVRLAIATLIQDVMVIPDNMDSFFACACRSTFDRLKMAPVLNRIPGDPSPCHLGSGQTIDTGFDRLADLGFMTEIGVPVNRLSPFIPESEDDKKIPGIHQLLELEKLMPAHRESHDLQTLLKNVMNAFIDFAQDVMKMSEQNNLDDQEFRAAIITLRLEFLTKIGKFNYDLLYSEFFDPGSEETVMLEHIQSRLKQILEDTKQYIISLK